MCTVKTKFEVGKTYVVSDAGCSCGVVDVINIDEENGNITFYHANDDEIKNVKLLENDKYQYAVMDSCDIFAYWKAPDFITSKEIRKAQEWIDSFGYDEDEVE